MLPSVGIPVFGPSALAARMEGSKSFSKDFMARHKIPTAGYKVFKAEEFEQAIEHVKTCAYKTVLKASGLAAGKGVLIPDTVDDAITGLREMMVDHVFGPAGLRPARCVHYMTTNNILVLYLRQRGRD